MSDEQALHEAIEAAVAANMAYRRGQVRQHIESIAERNREFISRRRRELSESAKQDIPADVGDGPHDGSGGSDAQSPDGGTPGNQDG